MRLMPVRLRMRARLDAPPAAVWAILADWERYPEWMPDVAWVRALGPERGEGMRLAVRTKVLGIPLVTDEMVIGGWDPPRRMAIEHRGLVEGPAEWLVEPADGGSVFTWNEELRMPPPILGAVALLAYSPILRWTFRRSIENLRRLVRPAP
ncbi:MAG: SRPBCC family protein [Actinobacteria bacterium]|nr:MAG: SRPBCC family protein [Actinomycetota bacterium]